MDACRYYIAKQDRRIFYEWTLIEGKNDTPEQAHALGRLLRRQEAQVNLIPAQSHRRIRGRADASARGEEIPACPRRV